MKPPRVQNPIIAQGLVISAADFYDDHGTAKRCAEVLIKVRVTGGGLAAVSRWLECPGTGS
jgi:hypothetical protein